MMIGTPWDCKIVDHAEPFCSDMEMLPGEFRSDIGVEPRAGARRVLRPVDLGILKDRRAGNRGKRRQSETTPIL